MQWLGNLWIDEAMLCSPTSCGRFLTSWVVVETSWIQLEPCFLILHSSYYLHKWLPSDLNPGPMLDYSTADASTKIILLILPNNGGAIYLSKSWHIVLGNGLVQILQRSSNLLVMRLALFTVGWPLLPLPMSTGLFKCIKYTCGCSILW